LKREEGIREEGDEGKKGQGIREEREKKEWTKGRKILGERG
jgi:hypothetical protein